jgi:hypothetical protein
MQNTGKQLPWVWMDQDGIEFHEEVLSFSVGDNTSWNAPGTAGQSIPFIIVSWRTPAEIIIVGYYSMEEAQENARTCQENVEMPADPR